MVELAGADVDLDAVERSIDRLLDWDGEVEFRTTCCPACVDRDVIEWVARRIAPADGDAGRVEFVLQRFEPAHCLAPAFREIEPYTAPQMQELLAAARQVYPPTRLRGA